MSPNFKVIARTGEPILHREDFWLPESPVHDEETGITWFTDTPRSVIYGFNVKEGQKSLKRIEVGDLVGCLALIDGVRYPHLISLLLLLLRERKKKVRFFSLSSEGRGGERGRKGKGKNGWTDVMGVRVMAWPVSICGDIIG